MKISIRAIKRKISAYLPESFKSKLRFFMKAIKTSKGNTEIPVEELKIFELLKDQISVVFDVGARDDLSFFRIKNNCEYHLFEPNVKSIYELKKQIALLDTHNITLNEFGLSDQAADNCVYYEDSQSFVVNPFYKANDKGHRYSLKRLDDYVSINNIKSIDFIKIDAEGLDYKIIQGGISTIRTKVSYIQFEFWDGVQKFIDLIGEGFDFYLMMEPRLYREMMEDVFEIMSEKQKSIDFSKSVIPIDSEIIDLIDNILAPRGYGGNVLGIKKVSTLPNVEKITFNIL